MAAGSPASQNRLIEISEKYNATTMVVKNMKLTLAWRRAWRLVRENSHLLVMLNLLFFVCVGGGWWLQLRNPGLEESFWSLWQEGGAKNELVQWSLSTWWGQLFIPTFLGIFLINFTAGSLFYLTLPSLVLPGAALPLVLLRGIIWGILTHSLYDYGVGTIILEGEAYITATFAALLHAQAWLKPASVPTAGHKKAYLIGLKHNLNLQILVAFQLFIAAIYETTIIVST